MSESRPPGRAVQMHKKLSSPSRKRDLTVGVQKQAKKQAKSQQLREQLLDDKRQHLQTLSEKTQDDMDKVIAETLSPVIVISGTLFENDLVYIVGESRVLCDASKDEKLLDAFISFV